MGWLMRTNEIRNMLHKHILDYPGVSFQLLKGVFNMSEGNLRYHLNMLEKEEKVRSKIVERERCFFPYDLRDMLGSKGIDPDSLSREESRILRLLRSRKLLSFKELVEGTGLSRKEVSSALRSLKRNSLIVSNSVGDMKIYQLATRKVLAKRMERILLIKLARGEIDEDTFLMLEKELKKNDD